MREFYRYLRIILVIAFVIACIVLGVVYGSELKYKDDYNDIQSLRNPIIDNYKNNKSLAESYLKVYEIIDENSYQRVKNDMYNSFSTEMQQSLFPTINYTGLPLHSMKTTLIESKGTNYGSGTENVFLIKYNLKGINYDQDITNLVFIESHQISKVIRID